VKFKLMVILADRIFRGLLHCIKTEINQEGAFVQLQTNPGPSFPPIHLHDPALHSSQGSGDDPDALVLIEVHFRPLNDLTIGKKVDKDFPVPRIQGLDMLIVLEEAYETGYTPQLPVQLRGNSFGLQEKITGKDRSYRVPPRTLTPDPQISPRPVQLFSRGLEKMAGMFEKLRFFARPHLDDEKSHFGHGQRYHVSELASRCREREQADY
jgi:hypothetical protein